MEFAGSTIILGFVPFFLGAGILFSGKADDLWNRDAHFREVTILTACACMGLGFAFILPGIFVLAFA